MHRPALTRYACASITLTMLVCWGAEGLAYRQTKTCYLPEENSVYTPVPPNAVCREGQVGRPMSWPEATVTYMIHERGPANHRDESGEQLSAELLGHMQLAMEQWNAPDCSKFSFVFGGLTSVEEHDSEDGINLIAFGSLGQSAAAVATTFTLFDTRIGRALDSDIILNDETHLFEYDLDTLEEAAATHTDEEDPEGGLQIADMRGVLAHEAGHMLGLDHSGIVESTMWAEPLGVDLYKRDLHADDINGLCSIYPNVDDLVELDDPTDKASSDQDEGCCATAPARRPRHSLLWILALAAVLGSRRRSRSAR